MVSEFLLGDEFGLFCNVPHDSYGKQKHRYANAMIGTTLGIHRATDEQVEARLTICRSCPGGHATWKNGDVHIIEVYDSFRRWRAFPAGVHRAAYPLAYWSLAVHSTMAAATMPTAFLDVRLTFYYQELARSRRILLTEFHPPVSINMTRDI